MMLRTLRLAAILGLIAMGLVPSPTVEATPTGLNGPILFFRGESFGSGITSVNPDGSAPARPLPGKHYGEYESVGAWSPDGSEYAFATSSNNTIYVTNIVTQAERSLRTGGTFPDFAPDGKTIAFSRGDEIWSTSAIDGTGSRQLTNFTDTTGKANAPSYSPDGSQIAFVGETNEAGIVRGIYVMPAAGGTPSLLIGGTDDSVYSRADWSPDGTKLSYSVPDPAGAVQMHVYDISKNSDAIVAAGEGPVWSPDGTKLAFASGGHIWTMDASGGTATQIQFCGGNFFCANPRWSVQCGQKCSIAKGCDESAGDTCGSNADDVIVGTESSDTIVAGSGNDTIFGGGGNDTISGGDGNDVIHGEAPPEGSSPRASSQEEEQETSNDTIDAGAGNDTIVAGIGVDKVTGGAGSDKAFGDDGNDNLIGSAGNDRLTGGLGDDKMNGGAGKDVCFIGKSKSSKDKPVACESTPKRNNM